MLNVDIVKAESCFSDLIAQSIGGKEIVITRYGQPGKICRFYLAEEETSFRKCEGTDKNVR